MKVIHQYIRLIPILVLLPVTLLLAQPHAHPLPNIVLIVADDHGIADLGCYGNGVIKTPNLDKLAADGVKFTNAFCTTASCSPSRSVMLTGLHNHANGMYGLQHQEHHFSSLDTIKSLPVLLGQAGYRTARVGKFHLAPEKVYAFQTVLSSGASNDPNTLGRSPVAMAQACTDLIREKSDKPFFLYFATDDPHRSNVVLADGRPSFVTYPEPNRFGNRPESYPGIREVIYRPADVLVPAFLPDLQECRAELAQYYQAVSRLDQGVGKLIQLLREAGQYDNTWIVYISDNGIAFPGAKTTLYEPGIHVPCLVRSPTQKKRGITQSAMITWADITPTLLEIAGIAFPPNQFHGRSFRSILEQPDVKGWDEVYASHSVHEITMYYPMRAVRTRQYKLIYNIAHELTFPMALDLLESSTWKALINRKATVYGKRSVAVFFHRPKWELYDLNNDPDEVINLVDRAEYKGVLQALMGKLKNFQQRTRDPWVHKWEYE